MNLKPLQLVFLLFSLLGVMCKKEPIKKEEITGLPQINTNAVTITSAGTATSGGRTLSSGDGPITAKGICWGIQENPDFSGNYTINGNGMGDYVSKLEGLSKNTQYYVRAYATNNKGTSFGESVKFAISSKAPELTDLGCQKIKGTSAEIHFSISSNYENATMEIHYGKDTSFSQKKIFNAPSK